MPSDLRRSSPGVIPQARIPRCLHAYCSPLNRSALLPATYPAPHPPIPAVIFPMFETYAPGLTGRSHNEHAEDEAKMERW